MKDNRNPRRHEDSRPRRNEDRRPRRFEEPREEEENEGQIEGRNALTEALRSGRTIDKVFIAAGETDRGLQRLAADAKEAGAVVVPVDRRKLDAMSQSHSHQGVIALVAAREYFTLEDILQEAADRGEAPLIVICDGITDPYNLGAIIRCAECCGAHGLIIPKRRAVGLTPVVTKASCGAIEHLAIAKVTNIAATVEDLQKRGIWVFAAEAGGTPYYETDFNCPCAVVLGSEGDGVSKLVKDRSDYITSIPMYGKVNSFNVSTAAAVILAEVSKQHRS